MLCAMLAVQVAVIVAIAALLVFPMMGRDRQAAIAAARLAGV